MTVKVIIEHCMVAYEIVSDYLLLICGSIGNDIYIRSYVCQGKVVYIWISTNPVKV